MPRIKPRPAGRKTIYVGPPTVPPLRILDLVLTLQPSPAFLDLPFKSFAKLTTFFEGGSCCHTRIGLLHTSGEAYTLHSHVASPILVYRDASSRQKLFDQNFVEHFFAGLSEERFSSWRQNDEWRHLGKLGLHFSPINDDRGKIMSHH